MPYAPGGATDITSRLFGEQMRQSLGQQFVVENKPGAFGILAIEEMARSRPDGYTLFVGNVSTNAITPVLFQKKFSINFERDVVSVSRMAIYPSFLLTTTQDFEAKTVADVIANAKKNPGKVRYTSAGVGSFPHYDMEVFARRRRYRDDPHSEQDRRRRHDQRPRRRRRAGRLPQRRQPASMIKAGKLRPVAVRAEQRLADYPDVPTLAEAGFPGIGTLHWQSMLAPANTPKEVLATLFKAIVDASKVPSLQEAFAKQFVSVKPNDLLEESQAWLKNELPTAGARSPPPK